MKSFLLFLTLFLCCLSIGFSQVQNSNKEAIADFYDASSKRFTFKGGEIAFQFRLDNYNRKYVDSNNNDLGENTPALRTAEKIDGLFLDLGFVNTSSFTDLDALDFDKIGYKLGLTYQHSFSKVYFKSDYEQIIYPKLFAWKLTLSGTLDRFDNFDPTTNEIDNVLPVKAGINGNISRYLFTNKNSRFNFHLIPTASFRFNFVDYNNLDNYLLDENSSNNGQVAFTSNSSFDGKYGVLENNNQSSFVSISLPMITKHKTFLGHIVPLPHFSWQTFDNKKPYFNSGIALGFLPKGLFGDDKKNDKDDNDVIIPNTHYRSFNAPSFLSVGVDWNFIGETTRKPQFSVSGTFYIK